MNLQDELDNLAESICKRAIHKDTPLDQSIEGLKAATAYYTARHRATRGESSDDNSGPDFGQFNQSIRQAGDVKNGTAAAKPPASGGGNSR